VSKGKREAIADWLMLLGGPILLGSLFLTWSHQFSREFLTQYGGSAALQGIPHDPDAWQLYSAVDVLLALLAGGLIAVALRGSRHARIALILPLAVALAFTVHALGVPPVNGADIFDAARGVYVSSSPTSGPGEVAALIGLALGLGGVLLSLSAD
jgi:hypothetical protein